MNIVVESKRYIVKNWFQYLKSSPFIKNVSIVMSGTAVAQLISFLLTPVISRLFDPSDFGVFGSFSSVLNVVAAFVTLQYSQAIMLPKEDQDAANVFAVSILSVVGVAIVGLVSAYLFSDWLLNLLKSPQSSWLLWFLPLGILVTGINQSVQAWCIRRKAFQRTSLSQVVRSVSGSASQMILGFFKTGSSGLIVGLVAAEGIASLNLARQAVGKDRVLLQTSLAWNRIRKLAIEYHDFPLYSATQNLMSAFSQGLPVLMLSHFYGVAIAGAYAFGMRVTQVPFNFVLTSLRQVLFQRASEAHSHGQPIYPLFLKATLGLVAVSLLPSLLIFFAAPQLFAWIFGEQWRTAGQYAGWMILWLMVAFCNVPSTLFARILRKQKQLFFYELVQLLLRAGSLWVGCIYFDAFTTVILFSIVGMLLSIFLIGWIGYAIKILHEGRDFDILVDQGGLAED